jgi:hypothetical protein
MRNVKVPGGVNIFKKAHPKSVFSMELGKDRDVDRSFSLHRGKQLAPSPHFEMQSWQIRLPCHVVPDVCTRRPSCTNERGQPGECPTDVFDNAHAKFG